MNEKVALQLFAERIRSASDELIKNLANNVTASIPPLEFPKPKTLPLPATEEIAKQFPEDLRELLTFTVKENFVVIKPTHFLGSDRFSDIAKIVKGLGGEYISAGKASHFRVPCVE